MPALLFFFARKKSIFFGIALIILAVVVLSIYRSFFTGILLRITLLGGYFLVIMSTTPLPGLFYWCLFLVLMAFFVSNIISSYLSRKAKLLMATPLTLASLIGLFMELPCQFTSNHSDSLHNPFYIIGDSISDGIGRERTWTDLLADEHEVDVINLAVAGATCQTALSQARQIRTENALVLLEIGGNDLLGNQSAKDFGKDLKALIKRVSKNGHTIF